MAQKTREELRLQKSNAKFIGSIIAWVLVLIAVILVTTSIGSEPEPTPAEVTRLRYLAGQQYERVLERGGSYTDASTAAWNEYERLMIGAGYEDLFLAEKESRPWW